MLCRSSVTRYASTETFKKEAVMANLGIIRGPGKFDLMLSLFEGKKITFNVIGDPKGKRSFDMEGVIHSLSIEDGSRESWFIKFYYQGKIFEGWYHTKPSRDSNRKGYFEVTPINWYYNIIWEHLVYTICSRFFV